MKLQSEYLTMDNKPGFCLGSSGKLMNQYLIKDHMLSHYKKLYSAKAAVDCSVPKSMHTNVKYVDQKRREQLSQSGRSDSQRSTRINSRNSCSSKNSRPSAQGAYHYLDQSLMSSSPRISTSFHSKQVVYPSQTVCTSKQFRSASELTYRSPKPQWQHSTSGSQRAYSGFQDPVQKTYSGDVLLKHAHRFTPEKPFTPRMLKSDHQSTLLQYRYYTPPRRKASEEKTSAKMLPQETYRKSVRSKQASSPQIDSPQPFALDHEWSDVETDSFRLHSKANRFRDGDFLLSSSRISPEGMRSPIMRKVSAEEEELMYLEFITDVTNEILTQGLYSDRVLKRVFERHIDINRYRLDENKMRHLLNNLQDDLQSPPSVPVPSLSAEQPHSSSQLWDKGELASDDVEALLHGAFEEERRQTAVSSTPLNHSLLESNHNEDSEFSLNDNPHLTYAEENLMSAGDDDQVLEELGRIMEESLSVSETPKNQQEQNRGDISDDDEY